MLETFPRVFCFPKSRINENGGKSNCCYQFGFIVFFYNLKRTNEKISILSYCSLRSKRFLRVWEQRKTEERGFRYFASAENGARAKKRTVRVGEGKEGNACGQTPGF